MKKIILLVLALLLTGCAGAPAETQPPEVTGNLKITCLTDRVQVDCNGQTMEFGAAHGIEQDGYLDCAGITVLGEQVLLVTFGESSFLFLGDLDADGQRAMVEENRLPSAQVLQLYGEPTRELLAAVEPTYVLTPEKTKEAWAEEVEHFAVSQLGPVSAESDGTTISISCMFLVNNHVTAAPSVVE